MQKIALVTGGNSGIGFATAKLFKERRYKVFIAGRSQERLEEAAAALGVDFIIADMSSPMDVEQLAKHFAESGLDVLVNNAATALFIPVESTTETNFADFFHTNVRGPMMLIRDLLPALEKRSGSIVNISSVIVDNGLPNASLYAATKGALEAMTRSLAVELADRGVRVNVVAPGAVDTPIIQKLGLAPEVIAGIRAQQEAMIPLHRYGRPEEIASAILAMAEATYATGSRWCVDGGVGAR